MSGFGLRYICGYGKDYFKHTYIGRLPRKGMDPTHGTRLCKTIYVQQ